MADTEKLRKDLDQAADLLNNWSQDPAEVLVQYGLADAKSKVQVRFAGKRGQVQGKAESCGCGCAASIEFEYET